MSDICVRDRVPLCPHGSREDISSDLVLFLERLEREMGCDLGFRSGFRCEECNRRVGGVEGSSHIKGRAVDVVCLGGVARLMIVGAALRVGARRVGVGVSFVHLDVDADKVQDVLWVYR